MNKIDWTKQISSLSLTGNQRNRGRYWRKSGTRWHDTRSPIRPLRGRPARADQPFRRCDRDGKTLILSAVSGESMWRQATGWSSSNTHKSNCDKNDKKQTWRRVCCDVAFLLSAITVNTWSLLMLYCIRNVVAHGDARKEKWRGNGRMEWVASTLTRPRNVVYPALLTLMRTTRLPVVDWTDSPAD
jgi:hypothetical protein